jgi:hypothetical protein
MAAQLNHTIVWSSDQMKSATFLAEMLGRPAPTRVAHFDVVELDNGVEGAHFVDRGVGAHQAQPFFCKGRVITSSWWPSGSRK